MSAPKYIKFRGATYRKVGAYQLDEKAIEEMVKKLLPGVHDALEGMKRLSRTFIDVGKFRSTLEKLPSQEQERFKSVVNMLNAINDTHLSLETTINKTMSILPVLTAILSAFQQRRPDGKDRQQG